MPLTLSQQNHDKIHNAILADNLSEYKLILDGIGNAQEQIEIVKDSLYGIVLHGAISILGHALTNHYIIDYLANDDDVLDSLLDRAIKSKKVAVLNMLLEMPIFRDAILKYPKSYISAAATSTVPVLEQVIQSIQIEDNLDAFDNIAFISALVDCNRSIKNYLLQFPNVFEFVDSEYEYGADYIAKFLEDYFPKLESRIKLFKASNKEAIFDVDSKEAKLGFLILRNLIKTYHKRDELKMKAAFSRRFMRDWNANSDLQKFKNRTKDLIFSCIPDNTNVHLKRIKLLLAIPSINTIAHSYDNQLLRLAIGLHNSRGLYRIDEDREEIIKLLRNVKNIVALEEQHPIDVQFAVENPIDFKALYKKSYPSLELVAYINKAIDLQEGDPIGTCNLDLNSARDLNCSKYAFSRPRSRLRLENM